MKSTASEPGLSKSTLSPDEDLQCAVETSRSISK